ncbi:MAG TPA: SusC/RagA family TonB-linked outer membrane protein [Halalkalibaculum sp.]|nr:SusC/RagA family TonB-linked outer membrane protein [Halalkalibaculum sp.]
MFKKISYSVIAIFLCLPITLFAQATIEGTVTEGRTGEPMPGVNVIIQGTTIGASTNADGEYAIDNVDPGTYTLEARFIGFASSTQEITVESETVEVNFVLRQSSINLNEVVVTGAGGPVEKKKLGNSIGTIDSEELTTAPINTFSDVLQGREPGLVGLPSGGATGEGSRIRIRGSASLSQSNEPLIYIDGVRVDNGGGFGGLVTNDGGSPSRLDDINPDIIKRVEVLKGAAAATLYGTEASNGVIQIFTKKGAVLDQPQFDLKIQNAAIRYPTNIIEPNTGWAANQAAADAMNETYGTSLAPYQLHEEAFVEEMFETGYGQTYSASVQGGNPGITYFVSSRWTDENGPFAAEQWPGMPAGTQSLVEDENKKLQFNTNVNIYPSDKLQFRITTGYTDTQHSTWPLNNNTESPTSLALLSKPQLASPTNYSGIVAFATVAEGTQLTFDQDVQHFNGSIGANYQPLEMLALDATFGVDFTNQFSEFNRPFGWNISNFTGTNVEGERTFSDRNNLEITADIKGTLNNTLSDDFESSFIFGTQGFVSRENISSGSAVGFPGPGLTVSEAADQQSLDEDILENVNLGVFGQEQIGFRDYLFGTVGARLDANSAFGSDFSVIVYPKASLSFIPTDAPFWGSADGAISSLLLRSAIGQSGLQPGAFDALTTFTSFSSTSGAGIAPQNLGNPDLKPEISTEWELGMELGMFNGRLGFETTYWNRSVTDALVARQFPVSGGFVNPQLDNIGELTGQGIEISLEGTAISKKDLQVNLFANTAYLYEKVESLGGAPPIKVSGSYTRHRNFITEGFAPGAHFGAKLMDVQDGFLPVDLNGDGQPDSEQELLSLLAGPESDFTTAFFSNLPSATSNVLIVDEDGDGDFYDHYLGKPSPDFSGAFGTGIDYKQFSLNALFEYQFGNYYINNLGEAFRSANPSIGRNTPETARVDRDYATGGVDENFTPQNDPQVRLNALKDWVNNYLGLAPFQGLNWVQQADFLRFRELSLTYRVSREALTRFGVRNLSFTASGRNLALWTKFDGDPEVNEVGRGSGTSLDQNFLTGVSTLGVPIPRRFIFTVNLGF